MSSRDTARLPRVTDASGPNLLSYSGYYDIALRDFGLMLGALGRLAVKYDPAGLSLRVRE